ncbi:MAG TPA: hypothetical protein VFE15_12945 [Marmoricola sp.]|jgi:hypothetical protein|nr:hypothetical protein [Marmoricola sp.]
MARQQRRRFGSRKSSSIRFTGSSRTSGQRSDGMATRDGVAIPVWSAEATDPVDYLASVFDLVASRRDTGGQRGS